MFIHMHIYCIYAIPNPLDTALALLFSALRSLNSKVTIEGPSTQSNNTATCNQQTFKRQDIQQSISNQQDSIGSNKSHTIVRIPQCDA